MVLITQNQIDLLTRNSLPYFIAKTFTTVEPAEYKHNWHIDYISEYLEACRKRQIKRLIVNIPPGYTKSIAVNVAFSAWLMGHNPKERILSASHSYSLSVRMSNKAKMVVESEWYGRAFPETVLQTNVENRQDLFKTMDGGMRQAVSVMGKVTGGGGDVLMIDDPIDAQDAGARSGLAIRKCNDWFDHTFYSRLRDKKDGLIILIMQRLHEEDLTAHLIRHENYEHCMIPVVEDSNGGRNYSFGNFKKERKEGEYLFEAIEGKKEIELAKKTLGPYGFAGQYMQRPVPMGGGIFKSDWWKYYEVLPKLKYRIVVADTAMKTKEMNDYSVFGVFGIGEDGNIYVIDIVRNKWEAPELEIAFVAAWNKHRAVTNGDLRKAHIEDKVSGTGLIQKIQRDHKIPVEGIKRDSGDKVERAQSVSGYVSSGYVYLPKDADWLSDFLSEMAAFPNGKHDDQVDVLVDGIAILTKPVKEIFFSSF